MICSDKYKFVFVAIPKTGTRSLYSLLINHYEGNLLQDHRADIPAWLSDYYSFTVVRNIYDRVISLWWFVLCAKNNKSKFFRKRLKSEKLVDLLKFMTKNDYIGYGDTHFKPQSSFIKGNSFSNILHFEHLAEDLFKLPFYRGESLRHENATILQSARNPQARSRDPFLYINQESLDLINDYYSEDFETLPEYERIEYVNH